MSIEIDVLGSAIKDRDAYHLLRRYCEDDDFSIPGKMILTEIDKYYDKDDTAKAIDKDILANRLQRRVSSKDQGDFLVSVLDNIGDESVPNIVQELLEMKRDKTAGGLIEALHSKETRRITELMDKYKILQDGIEAGGEGDSNLYVGLGKETFKSGAGKADFMLLPKSLNERLDGGVSREDHVGIFARPEIGKSLFSINASCGMLRRGHRVLYFGNEDAAEKMRLRFICNLTNTNKWDVLQAFDEYTAEAMAKGGENLIFKSSDAGNIQELDRLIDRHRPDAFVVDQIRNFIMPGCEGLTNIIEQGAKGCRQLAKKYGVLAMSVTQAGESGSNKAVLLPEDVDYSNTGYFGAVDLLIGIGASKSHISAGRRYIQLSKNKISDRHEGFTVIFDHATSRVRSVD